MSIVKAPAPKCPHIWGRIKKVRVAGTMTKFRVCDLCDGMRVASR
jgi:hypothetical protein